MLRAAMTIPTATRKGDRTRATIVACAQRLFYQRGYDGTSFADIVEASNLHRGNIYHYFKTKDDILKAVVRQHLLDFQALLDSWQERDTGPKARLLAFLHMLTSRKPDLIQYGCPIGTLNTELGKDRRNLQHEAQALFDLFKDWLAARFEELGYPADDAEQLSLHYLGRAQGIAVITHVYHDARLLRREIQALETWVHQLPAGSG